ncbi:MAG: hypothetical protein O3B64_03335 [bacterium]|nr:hypothetical protein [bacterium]MDA1024441.1 hypothetical protein [bacterium]
MSFLTLFVLFAGFIIGLGALTVIDCLGFLGRTSSYWTEATTRAHKVTKPLIWLGMTLAVLGGILFYTDLDETGYRNIHLIVGIILVINGSFLSCYISPYLLKQEKAGKSTMLLPRSIQVATTISFFISFLGWWGSLILFLLQIAV